MQMPLTADKISWVSNELQIDSQTVHEFDWPIRAVVPAGSVIIVLTRGPRVDQSSNETDIEEANRNVFGIDSSGRLLWRIKSRGSGSADKHDPYRVNSFSYISRWADQYVLHDSFGPFETLDPQTGEMTPMNPTRRADLLRRAREAGGPFDFPAT